MRQARVALYIGAERRVLFQHLDELGADFAGGRLEALEPGERGALVKLELRQPRKEILPRLLEIDFPAPGEDVERFAEARVRGHGKPIAQERFKRRGVAFAQ